LPSEVPIEAYAMSPDEVIDVLKQRATKELEDLSRALPTGISFGIRLDVGVPWQAICDAGRKESAALIVIGSHGYSGLDRLLGTTAARVVNHADRSVLVVRSTAPTV
jgi:universal stress protein F